nr:hypothetical protein [Chitinophagales bacterium]
MKKLLLVLFTFFFFCSFAQKQLLVLEGKDGFYVFVSSEVLSGKNTTGVTKVVISRAERGGTFAEIGAATATLDIQKMKERFGQQFPQQIASMLRLKDEGMLIDYMKMHPQLEDYALLMFDLDFFQAAGAVYMDKYKPVAGATLKYKAKFLKADGSALSEQPEGEVTAGKLPVFPKPRFFSRTEGDSALTVKWLGKTGTGEPGYFGNVYRQQGKGEFTMVGQILPFTSNDSILYTWYDQVRPGSQYRYFIRVTNLVGLEGTASDTATLVSANFNNTVKLENFAVKDTTGGIYFSWKAQ